MQPSVGRESVPHGRPLPEEGAAVGGEREDAAFPARHEHHVLNAALRGHPDGDDGGRESAKQGRTVVELGLPFQLERGDGLDAERPLAAGPPASLGIVPESRPVPGVCRSCESPEGNEDRAGE